MPDRQVDIEDHISERDDIDDKEQLAVRVFIVLVIVEEQFMERICHEDDDFDGKRYSKYLKSCFLTFLIPDQVENVEHEDISEEVVSEDVKVIPEVLEEDIEDVIVVVGNGTEYI